MDWMGGRCHLGIRTTLTSARDLGGPPPLAHSEPSEGTRSDGSQGRGGYYDAGSAQGSDGYYAAADSQGSTGYYTAGDTEGGGALYATTSMDVAVDGRAALIVNAADTLYRVPFDTAGPAALHVTHGDGTAAAADIYAPQSPSTGAGERLRQMPVVINSAYHMHNPPGTAPAPPHDDTAANDLYSAGPSPSLLALSHAPGDSRAHGNPVYGVTTPVVDGRAHDNPAYGGTTTTGTNVRGTGTTHINASYQVVDIRQQPAAGNVPRGHAHPTPVENGEDGYLDVSGAPQTGATTDGDNGYVVSVAQAGTLYTIAANNVGAGDVPVYYSAAVNSGAGAGDDPAYYSAAVNTPDYSTTASGNTGTATSSTEMEPDYGTPLVHSVPAENAPDVAGAAQTTSTIQETQLLRRATQYRVPPKGKVPPAAVPHGYEAPAQIVVYEKEKNRHAGQVPLYAYNDAAEVNATGAIRSITLGQGDTVESET